MTIDAEDRINRWVFYPQDFALAAEVDPLLNIKNSFNFPTEPPDNRRYESANLSRLMEPYPGEVHRLGCKKADAKLERYKAQGVDRPYQYHGFLECKAQAITSIVVSATALTLALDPIDDENAPNPAHVAIEMVSQPGSQDGKNVRNVIKDKLAIAFGDVIAVPA